MTHSLLVVLEICWNFVIIKALVEGYALDLHANTPVMCSLTLVSYISPECWRGDVLHRPRREVS